MAALHFRFRRISARTAALRLLNPLSDFEWPRVNRLAILRAGRALPYGQTFEVEVVDAAGEPLPDDLTIRYRYRDPHGEAIEESEPVQRIDRTVLCAAKWWNARSNTG